MVWSRKSLCVSAVLALLIVPWVEGLTLAQAIATAKYTGLRNPKAITITRQGGEISVDPRDLLGGHVVVPLQSGDTGNRDVMSSDLSDK